MSARAFSDTWCVLCSHKFSSHPAGVATGGICQHEPVFGELNLSRVLRWTQVSAFLSLMTFFEGMGGIKKQ